MTGEGIRLRFVAPLRSKSPPRPMVGDIAFLPMDAIGEDGTYDHDSVRQASDVGSGYTYFEQGDVIRARVTPCFENRKGAYLSALASGHGLGTTELFVFRPSERIDGRFLYYITVSDLFTGQGAATMYGAHGVRRVDDQFVRNFRISVPSISRQRSIADYLEDETARIDALIVAKRLMTALLGERRESSAARFADQAESTGCTVPLWTIMQPEEMTGTPELEILSVYRDHGIIPKSSRSDNYNKTPIDLSRYQVVSPGDVVVNKMKAWQGSVGVSEFRGIVSPDYLVCKMNRAIDPLYLHHFLRSPQLRSEFQRRSEGIRPAQWRLQWDQMRLIEIPVPAIDTQVDLVGTYMRDTASLQTVASALEKQMELLKERRRALITAVVTGQLDMPRAA